MLINCSQPLMKRAPAPYVVGIVTLIFSAAQVYAVSSMCFQTQTEFVATAGTPRPSRSKDSAAIKGEPRAAARSSSVADTSSAPKVPDDSIYVFESPVPLTGRSRAVLSDPSSFFIRLMISGNGYGLGLGYDYQVSPNWSVFADFALSGARNTSELELQDPYTFIVYVPNKINRLFILPLCLGTRYNIPKEYVADNIAPYISVGAGASAVVRAPYDPVNGDLFSSLGYADTYYRPAGFVGAGMIIESSEKSYATIDARYYIIPFGGEGLESVRGKPMKDFNGLFVSVAIGIR
jgi:hypothetical protein